MSTPSQSLDHRWVSKDAARRRLGVSVITLNALIESGALSIRRVPGSFTRLREDEVEALLEASIRPARQPVGI